MEKSASVGMMKQLYYPITSQAHLGALMFSPPAFGPSDNSTRTFQSMDTGSQKRLVLVTNVPQSGPTVRQPQNRSLGPKKS
jgi:hypothetical protein